MLRTCQSSYDTAAIQCVPHRVSDTLSCLRSAANLLMVEAEPVHRLSLPVCLSAFSSNSFHSISLSVCVPSPAHPYYWLAVVSAKHSAHSLPCCDTGEIYNIITPNDYVKLAFQFPCLVRRPPTWQAQGVM